MRIVLDTNVLISGLLTPDGNGAEILKAIVDARIEICLDERIMGEYRLVAYRREFGFPPGQRDLILDRLDEIGIRVSASPLPQPLPDPDDEPFLAVAVAAKADYLVTGNLKHFPANLRQTIEVVSPSEFLKINRQQQQ